MNCKKVQKKLYDYTKGEFTFKYMKLLNEHIIKCHKCKIELEKILKIKKFISNNILPPPFSVFYNLKKKIFGKLSIWDFLPRFKVVFSTVFLLLFLFISIFLYKTKTPSDNINDFIYNSYYFIEMDEDTSLSDDLIYSDLYM